MAFLLHQTAAQQAGAAGDHRCPGDACGETAAGVLAAVDADPRLPTQRDKCMIFHDLVNRSRTFSKKEYPTAGKNGCTAYPFDTYQWDG